MKTSDQEETPALFDTPLQNPGAEPDNFDCLVTSRRESKRRELPAKRGAGRPTLYDSKYNEIAKAACATLGAGNEDLAKLFGVSVCAVETWLRTIPGFFEAVRFGKDIFNTRRVEKSLLQRALGFETEEVTKETVELLNPGAGKKGEPIKLPGVKVKTTRKYIAPDTTACIFYLVNRTRKGGRWQNVYNVKVEGDVTVKSPYSLEDLSESDLVAARNLVKKISEAQAAKLKKGSVEA